MSNGFRMDAPFTEGISYISRDEEEQAKQRSKDRETRMANISEIDIDSLDEDAVAFLSRVRSEINESINSGEVRFLENSQRRTVLTQSSSKKTDISIFPGQRKQLQMTSSR